MITTDAALSQRLDAVAGAYLAARYSGPGNPLGSRFLRFDDGAFAVKIAFAPHNPLFNSVYELVDSTHLDAVLRFYAETGQCCWVEASPYAAPGLGQALTRAGFVPESCTSTMCVFPVPAAIESAGDVHEIGRADLETFLDTLNVGFGTPPALRDGTRRNQSFWADVGDWHLFLARVGGAPAGAAVMSIHGDIGYLAAGSVLPEWRARGIHAALIAARIKRARALGMKTVVGQAVFGSASQRNQQRAGLVIAHTKTVWSNHASLAGAR